MDFGRIIQMVLNQFLRRTINTGISKGIDFAARKGKPAAQMTPEQRQQAASARQLAKRARQAARLTRR
jgi:hypothetical protein